MKKYPYRNEQGKLVFNYEHEKVLDQNVTSEELKDIAEKNMWRIRSSEEDGGGYLEVFCDIAKNRKTPAKVLERIFKEATEDDSDTNIDIAYAVARNQTYLALKYILIPHIQLQKVEHI